MFLNLCTITYPVGCECEATREVFLIFMSEIIFINVSHHHRSDETVDKL